MNSSKVPVNHSESEVYQQIAAKLPPAVGIHDIIDVGDSFVLHCSGSIKEKEIRMLQEEMEGILGKGLLVFPV